MRTGYRPAASYFILSEFIYAYRISQHFPSGLQKQIRACLGAPFDQSEAAVFDFYAGDAGGMDTAAGVAVRGLSGADHGMMGMAGHQNMMLIRGPFCQALFGFFLFAVVFSCAGGIGDAQLFQRPPEITDQKAGERPEGAVQRVSLMTMGEIDIHDPFCILQDDARIKGNAGAERLFPQCAVAVVGMQMGVAEAVLLFDDIVVPIDGIQPPGAVEA